MYEDVKKHDDKLNEIDQIVDWEIFHHHTKCKLTKIRH
jgi:hypothetical protein